MDVTTLKVLESGGSLAIFAVLVFYFLKYSSDSYRLWSDKTEKAIQSLTDRFNAEMTVSRNAFQEQISKLADGMLATQRDTAAVTRETSVAIKGLEDAVRELQAKIKN